MLLVIFGVLFLPVIAATGQDAAKDRKEESLATVKGRIVQHANPEWQIDLAELKPKLVQFVLDQLPEPKLPDNWDEMTHDQRRVWIEAFEKSDAGQKLLAEQERVLTSARQFDVPVDEQGEFAIYDVPPATYGLSGRVDKKLGEYIYAFEVFGQLVVGDNVDEVLLDPIAVIVTPLFQSGQPVPSFELTTLDGKKIAPKSFQGRHWLIDVWSTEFSPPSVEFQQQIKEMLEGLKDKGLELDVLSICLDSEGDRMRAAIEEHGLRGIHARIEGWDDPFVDTLGIRALPWFMLVDEQGRILLTHPQIRQQFAAGRSLTDIVADAIEGKSTSNAGDDCP